MLSLFAWCLLDSIALGQCTLLPSQHSLVVDVAIVCEMEMVPICPGSVFVSTVFLPQDNTELTWYDSERELETPT